MEEIALKKDEVSHLVNDNAAKGEELSRIFVNIKIVKFNHLIDKKIRALEKSIKRKTTERWNRERSINQRVGIR